MHDREQIEQDVPTVCEPERLEEMAASIGHGENIHHDDNNGENDSCQS